jgi:hypothetical protein
MDPAARDTQVSDSDAETERRCPGCGASLSVDPDLLGEAEQLATCTRCGTYFALDDGAIIDAECADPFARATALRLSPEPPAPSSEPAFELPFEIPDDLPLLEPASEDEDSGEERRRSAGAGTALFGILLAAALLAQFAWHHRDELMQRAPALAALCASWQCPPTITAAPARFRVVSRDLRGNTPGAGVLTLDLRVRNDAGFAQPYPVLQLALLDNRGGVVQRGHLQPGDYLADAPAPGATVAAGETIAIAVDIADPGPAATGFAVDFY